MKFCGSCGQQNQDDAKFCASCGSRLKMADETHVREGSAEEESSRAYVRMPSDAGDNKRKGSISPKTVKAGMGIAAIIVLFVVIFKVAGFGRTKIDLNDYVTISVSGTDTVGTAEYNLDTSGLFLKLAETIGVNTEGEVEPYYIMNVLESGSKKWKLMNDLYNVINYAFAGKLDKTSDISNGDEVVFSWNNNKDQLANLEKEFKVSFKYKDIKQEVKELKEIEEYDPFENVEVVFDGYDSAGTAEIRNNDDGYDVPYFYYELDKYDGLSNGDTVTLSIPDAEGDEETFKKDYIRGWGVELTAISKEYTVEGLKEMEDYDPFNDISVSFSGISPNVSASIQKNNVKIEDLDFSVDKSENLRLGDTVTVTVVAYYDDPETLCMQEGKKLTATSKDYTVENVPKYASTVSEITPDMMNKMDQNAQDKLYADAASSWESEEKITEMTLIGNYFLTAKENADVYDYWSGESVMNRLYLVYKVSVQAGENPFTYYYFTCYKNIIIMEDGTCSLDLSGAEIPDGRVASADGYYSYNGYAELDTLKYKTVTANLDKYIYEENITE